MAMVWCFTLIRRKLSIVNVTELEKGLLNTLRQEALISKSTDYAFVINGSLNNTVVFFLGTHLVWNPPLMYILAAIE